MTSGDDEAPPPVAANPPPNRATTQTNGRHHHHHQQSASNNTEVKLSSTCAAESQTTRGQQLQAVMAGEQENTSDASARPEHDGQRPFDVIIFAASSSVGRYLVEELSLVVEKYYPSEVSAAAGATSATATTAATASLSSPNSSSSSLAVNNQFAQQLRRRSVPSSCKSGNSIRWAIAGRSAVRLSETLCQAELSTGIRNLSNTIPVILADLNHHRSLLNMCKKSRLVINCAGPYSELGAEDLIQACIESGTHYVDLAHETTFIESMTKLYSERARRRGVFILNGCGFQSMSAECGINFMKQVADGRIEQVKIILSLSDTSALIRLGPSRASAQSVGIVSRGMWNSLLVEKSQELSLEERIRQASSSSSSSSVASISPSSQHSARRQRRTSPLTAVNEYEPNLHGEDDDDDDDENDDHQSAHEHHTTRIDRHRGASSSLQTIGQSQSTSSGGSNSNSNNSSSSSSSAENTNSKRPIMSRILERKDTQWLVKDIVQFRNRAVSIAWPLQLIQGFQIQKGRGYCWPIDCLTSDESQLIRGEMNNYELRQPDVDSHEGWRPIRTSSFFSVKNFTHLCMLFIWLHLFQLLIKFSLTRYLMRKLPSLASLGHVTTGVASGGRIVGFSSSSSPKQTLDRDSLSHIKYCQTFIAYGQPSDDSGDPLEERDKHTTRRQVQLLVSRVVGPEPNHVATATFAIQAALTILMERDHLPASGGVLTPGAAFAETNIIYQLRRRNIKFEVLKKA